MKIVFMYSGQGAQYPGMMSDICESYKTSENIFNIASSVLERDIKFLSFNGPAEELLLTHNTQPCMLAADLSAAEALKANGIQPDGVAGFSLGEYGALVEANVLQIEDAFRIIQKRADAMQEAVPVGQGKMAAIVGATSDKVETMCRQITDDYVIASNYNSPSQTVISGTASGVDKVLKIAEAENIRCIELPVSAPFHCKLMEPAAERVREAIKEFQVSKASIPIYMNTTAHPLKNEMALPDLLYKQAMSPVLWKQSLQNMYEDGYDTFIECGPGKTLYNLARETLDKDKVLVLRVSDCKTLDKAVRTIKDR